jgi:hypothetical protein
VSDLEPAFPRGRSGGEKSRIVDTDSGDEVKELCYCRRTMAIVVKPLMCCDVGVVKQTCLEVLSLHASTSLSNPGSPDLRFRVRESGVGYQKVAAS